MCDTWVEINLTLSLPLTPSLERWVSKGLRVVLNSEECDDVDDYVGQR